MTHTALSMIAVAVVAPRVMDHCDTIRYSFDVLTCAPGADSKYSMLALIEVVHGH